MKTSADIAALRQRFRDLHKSGCFILPNPWDIGSARYLAGLGFKALATTSSGFAWSHGKPDGGMTRDEVLRHLRDMVGASDLPINADFENGYGADAQEVEESVRLAVETGVAGLSIEDTTGNPAQAFFDISESVARVQAARRAIDRTGGDTLLVARADNFFHGRNDLSDTLVRLRAYAHAGADCLYAPGIKTRAEIQSVVAAVHPKPVNLLIGSVSDLGLQDAAELGVRRISVGGGLARAAWGGFMRAAQEMADAGTFGGFASAAQGAGLNTFFKQADQA